MQTKITPAGNTKSYAMRVSVQLVILFLILSCKGLNKENSLKIDRNIVKQANALGQLFIDKDYDECITWIYPGFIKLVGKDNLLKVLHTNDSNFIKQEVNIDSIRFCKPQKIIKAGKELITSLTQIVYGIKSNVKFIDKTNAIAISEDNGANWYFILSADGNLDNINKLFPYLQNRLIIQNDPKIMDNTPQSNFKIFWNDFKNNYPVFELNGINWDSVYLVNYSKITSNTSESVLFNIFKSCILILKDAHCDISSNQFGRCNFYYTVIQKKPSNFLGRNVINKYIPLLCQHIVNNDIMYGLINKNIGYMYIGGFGGNERDYYFIDECLNTFINTKGIIIDIRQNGGGNENFAKIVASRFTNKTVTYRYRRIRNGPKYSDLSDFKPQTLDPGGKIKYTKTVALLTNRHTFSSAEDFALMLRSLPNVVQIGDTTFGGVGTNPQYKDLPNGWKYRISMDMNCDRNKKPIKNGIAPQIPIQICEVESNQGIDIILEEAVRRINKITAPKRGIANKDFSGI